VLLVQTRGRTYTEGFSLRWDHIDFDHDVIFFGGKTKTEGSSGPVLLMGLAHDLLFGWTKEQGGKGPFLFPSPVKPDQLITTVKTAWKTTLKNAGAAHFPIYHLSHVSCIRLSWVAPDPVAQRAMRHSSPETKRHFQKGMVDQARENIERPNERVYGKGKALRFYDGQPAARNDQEITTSMVQIVKEKVARPEGIEPPTLCLEADRPLLPNLARGGATGVVSASSGNSPQPTFSFVFPDSLTFCRCFPQLALRSRDSAVLSHITTNSSGPLICIVPGFFNSLAGTFLSALPELVRIILTYPTLDVFPHAHSHLAAGIGFPL
jgi:hypothetical protein